MKTSTLRFLCAALAASFVSAIPMNAQDAAVRGRVVYTMSGDPIFDAIVIVRAGKIAAIGPAAEIEIPAGLELREAAVVTPGLIDAHTVVGLAGWLNHDHDQDQLERSAPVQPELRAIDAYNPREPLIAWVRGYGVTTIHTGHGPGAVISGQTMIAKTRGDTVAEALVRPYAMLAATLGRDALGADRKPPGTRAKAVALLRSKLIEAQLYAEKKSAAAKDDEKEAPDRNLAKEALVEVLEGRVPLMITAQRASDIEAALRLAKEFSLRLVLDGAAESYLLLEEIRKAEVPVICHPPMFRAAGERENLSMQTPAKLKQAHIPLALQSGFESYVPKTRVVLFEAAIAAAYGMDFQDALGAITIDAARLLGIEDRVGSLEVGKDGDLALYDGDPFEYTSHCIGVFIEGVLVSDEVR